MFCGNLFLVMILVFHLFCVILSTILIPEHARILYVNPKYASDAKFYVKRYGRKSPYYINLDGTNKRIWTNNVTINFYSYEFLHNEYRRSFVEFNFKFCDLLTKEPFVGATFAKAGVACPLRVGYHAYRNITIPLENFPNVWPFEKGRIVIHIVQNEFNEVMGNGSIDATFKVDMKKKPKRI